MSAGVYYANCVAGLGGVAAGEIERRIRGATVTRVGECRAFFRYGGAPERLLTLRVPEDLFAYIGELSGIARTERGLEQIESFMAQLELGDALAIHGELRSAPAHPTFRITAARDGDHAYRSPQVAAAAGAGIVARTGWRVDLEEPDIDIWVEVAQDACVAGIRLTTDTFSSRSDVHGVASLKPTVAHAMCLLTEPAPGEVFLDPMCGTGTILAERWWLGTEGGCGKAEASGSGRRSRDGGGSGGGVRLIGSDADPQAVADAHRALAGGQVRAGLICGGAQHLPIGDRAIDKMVTNPPWGRRMSSHRQNRRLYPKFMAEACRVLREGGIMVILSLERRLMMEIIDDIRGLDLVSRTLVDIGGLEPSIYKLRRI